MLIIITGIFVQCKEQANNRKVTKVLPENRYNVAFLVMDGTYNTELTAPFDIFHHTIFRQGIKAMNVFTVAKQKKPITTFEGISIIPAFDNNTDSLPRIDVLVVPSAEHHLDSDLQDFQMIDFVRKTAKRAKYITSHCDGAFVLAKAGLLDGKFCTTFPSDIEQMRKTFPEAKVLDQVLFVQDSNIITSVGGARSFEAALYLCQEIYGVEVAKQLSKGLVIDWELNKLKYFKKE